MTDRDPDLPDSLPAEGTAPARQPTPGTQLRSAREAMHLTAPDISARLHLDLRIIEALEADRYEELRAPAYVCGYLRSYGRQVGLDGDTLVRAYETRSGLAQPPPLHPFPSQPAAQADTSHSGVRLAAVLVAIVVLGLAFVWWTARAPAPGEAPIVAELPADTPPPAPVVGQAESGGVPYRYPIVDPSVVDPAAAGDAPTGDTSLAYRPPGEPATDAGTGEVAADAAAADAVAAGDAAVIGVESQATAANAEGVPTTAAAESLAEAGDPAAVGATATTTATTGTGQVSITIGLSAQSWVEVYDANDRRLFFNMASGGQTIATRGDGPLRVIIGNIRAARLSVEGQDVPLLPLAREGVARLLVTQAGAEPLPRPAR
ncbi:MAG TPA: hypothetical protein DCY89_09885 [Gammaproteobacteria bacterium]|nr:hypothetical protein [Gammaproteobacteria bacterium]